jgi:HAD superfamily hydrolase (TIGR01509 family)
MAATGDPEKTRAFSSLMKEMSAVIFDFDNIIVDSEPYHFKAYQKVFAGEGHHLDRDEYWMEWTFKGGGAEGEIERHDLPLDPEYIRSLKDPVYSNYCRSGEIGIYPEARNIIENIGKMGFIIAIASGSYRKDILSILDINGMTEYFSAVVGKDMVSRTKPRPDTYLKAAEEIGTDPLRCVAVEDAVKGIISAHEAGMKVIAVETEITAGFDLGEADLVVSGLSELADLVEGLRPS